MMTDLNNKELKINVLNVNSGDTIFLNWKENDVIRFGIIDSSYAKKDKPPIINELKNFNIIEIDFILITHCHTDHFKGIFELILYLKDNGIKVKNLLHTLPFHKNFNLGYTLTRKQREDLFYNSMQGKAKKTLQLLYDTLWKESDKEDHNRLIEEMYRVSSNYTYNYGSLTIKFLSPRFENEIMKYYSTIISNEILLNEEESLINNSVGNLLSAVSLISFNNSKILLTSDSELETIERIKSEYCLQNDDTLHIIQLPHHGSAKSFKENIWNLELNTKENVFFASSGDRYKGHPDMEMCIGIDKKSLTKAVLCTNCTTNYSQFKKEASKLTSIFNIENNRYDYKNGPIQFHFIGELCEITQNNKKIV